MSEDNGLLGEEETKEKLKERYDTIEFPLEKVKDKWMKIYFKRLDEFENKPSENLINIR